MNVQRLKMLVVLLVANAWCVYAAESRPDTDGALVSRLESTGAQIINTGVMASDTLRIELDFIPVEHNTHLMVGTEANGDSDDWRVVSHPSYRGVMFDCGTARAQSGTSSAASRQLTLGTRYLVKAGSRDSEIYVETYNADGTLFASATAAKKGEVSPAPVCVFGGDVVGSMYGAKMILFSLKMFEGDVLVRDFVPWRRWDEKVGLLDLKDGAFYPNNAGSGIFLREVSYATTGTAVEVYEGKLGVTWVDGFRLVTKKRQGTVFAAAVLQYSNLTLEEGTFSLVDNRIEEISVSSSLVLSGGVELDVDVASDVCDGFVAESVDLAGASEANPVLVDYRICEGENPGGGPLVLMRSSSLAENDAKKFRSKNRPARFCVQDGMLKMMILPSGYMHLESLTSTGDQQLINTGVLAKDSLQAEMDFISLENTTKQKLGTLEGGDSADWRVISHSSYRGLMFDCGSARAQSGTSSSDSKQLKVGSRYLVRVGSSGSKIYAETYKADGSLFTSVSADKKGTVYSAPIHVFGGYTSATGKNYEKMTLFSLKMFDGGMPVRDYVPCVNAMGDAGLYDFVEKSFAGKADTGAFKTDCDGRPLCCIQSTGEQVVDTGVLAKKTLRVEIDFRPIENSTHLFLGTQAGTDANDWRITSHSSYRGIMFDCGSARAQSGTTTSDSKALTAGSRYLVKAGVRDAVVYADVYDATGDVFSSSSTNMSGSVNSAPVHVMGGYVGDTMYGSKTTLYSLKIYDGDELIRDLVPWLKPDGAVGLLDRVNSKFYASDGVSGLLAFAHVADGQAVRIFEGEVLSDVEIAGYPEVVKEGAGSLVMSSVQACPPLSLEEGELSLVDGVARRLEVAGELKLHGGMRIAVDVCSDGCDSLGCSGSVDLVDASHENPVVFKLCPNPGVKTEGRQLTLISAGLSAGDEKKFRIANPEPYQRLKVVDSALVAVVQMPLLIMIR